MWNNCHLKLTGDWDWQEDSCTTKSTRKFHMQLGRQGSKAIRSGPVTLGGDKEDGGAYTNGDPPWGVSSLSQTLGAWLWGTTL